MDLGPGHGDSKVTFWKQKQVVESMGVGGIPGPSMEALDTPWVLVMMSCLQGLRTIFNTTHMPGGAAAFTGLDCSAVKGLRVRGIKVLNCHVDSKSGNWLCRGLNKSALDLWTNLIQQKIISAAY